MSKSLRCLVTGGAGFIGSHLSERLAADGHRVVILDDFSTGRPDNVAALLENPSVSLITGSVTDPAVVESAMRGVDWVFHLAALADIVPSITHPQAYHRVNVDGTFTVLEAARAQAVKRFVYVASSSCYGLPDVFPTPETAPLRPMYPYALTKCVGEQYALHWALTYDLPVVSLRLFNVFGPRHRSSGTYGAVFGVFLAQKLAGLPLTVVGDGTQTRDFTYVTDVADALVTAAASDLRGEIFNVGSGGTYSVNRLVELLGGDRVAIPKRPGEPDTTFADIAKIGRDLGWAPKVGFEEGVSRILERIDDWKQAPVWTVDKIETATADWFRHLGRQP